MPTTREGFVLVEQKVANDEITRVWISDDDSVLTELRGQMADANSDFYRYTFRRAGAVVVERKAVTK